MNWQMDELQRLVDRFRSRGAVTVSIPIDIDLMEEMIACTRRDHDQAAKIAELEAEITELLGEDR